MLCFVASIIRETESEKVEAQVAAMEARLAMMKLALSAEKQKFSQTNPNDANSSNSQQPPQRASRWKSGSVNAGSLTGYAKDVKNRGRRKKRQNGRGANVNGPRGRRSGSSKFVTQNVSNRRNNRRQKTPRGGRTQAHTWSQDEVGCCCCCCSSKPTHFLISCTVVR